MSQQQTAQTFRSLHEGPGVLVLPNAWDAASAAILQDAGARAVATSSAAVAWSHGYADGHDMPVPVLITALGEIARVLSAPLTADIESGYSDDPAQVGDTVGAVIGAGAVGVNLEDGEASPDLHCRKIEAAREAAVKRGVALFVNARIDVYLRGLAQGEAALAQTLDRARRYQAAGADGIFVPGPADEALIAELAQGIDLPLNVMARSGAPSAARLQDLGVRRLSSASGLFRAAFAGLVRAAEAFLRDGDPGPLAAAGQGAPDLNARFAFR